MCDICAANADRAERRGLLAAGAADRNQQKFQVGAQVRCVNCQGRVLPDHDFCPWCGFFLDADSDPQNPATDVGGTDDGDPAATTHYGRDPVVNVYGDDDNPPPDVYHVSGGSTGGPIPGIAMMSSSFDARGYEAWRERRRYLESLGTDDGEVDDDGYGRRSFLDSKAEQAALEAASANLEDCRSAVSISRGNFPEGWAGLTGGELSPDARHRFWCYQSAVLEEGAAERAYDAARAALERREAQINQLLAEHETDVRVAGSARGGLYRDPAERASGDLATYSDDERERAGQQRADDIEAERQLRERHDRAR